MDAIWALHNRVSVGQLKEPAPNAEQRQRIFRAALRAADHANLRPWRFLVVEGDARAALGEVFVQACNAQGDMSDFQVDRTRGLPQRAPLIVVAVTCTSEHPKVPLIEQRMSTAGAVQALLTAAFAEGVGAYWRTGDLAFNRDVHDGLGLAANEEIAGFIYMGTPKNPPREAPQLAVEDYFSSWTAK
ncbi:nitroreductase family protein [Biformimicrobium ophioploci]|uniref:Putative NAD(P)H nitroreductase n=1 Tax=Biformimicrobium ophioploci TaxID=3036711 RepID=A0ABQ6LY53_9GAMM|nr:nitroreductase [Microbulbifer sp. NKW57]GMG86975.1 nitroreductase family protein [Microbulbifer sp. NKW57]